MRHGLMAGALIVALGNGALAVPPGPIDGLSIPSDYAGSDELGVQTNRTGFGNQVIGTGDFTPGSELDEMFLASDGSYLYVGLTGNLEKNGHAFVIFIDAPFFVGQTELRAEGVGGPPFTVQTASRRIDIDTNGTADPADDTWDYGTNGTILPCEADYALAVDVFGGTMSVSEYLLFDPSGAAAGTTDPTPGNPGDPLQNLYAIRNFIGQSPTNDGNEIFETQNDPNFTQGGFNDTNTTGVTDTDASQASDADTGFEIAIPLSNIGFGLSGSETVNVFVAIIDGGGANGTIVNQTLPPVSAAPECDPPAALGLRPDLSAVATCSVVDLSTLFAPFGLVAEGNINPVEYVGKGAAQETQTCPTAYGDQQFDPNAVVPSGGSELDVLYADNDAGFLYLGVTGNLERGGNTLHVFIDSDPDGADLGQHTLDTNFVPFQALKGLNGDEAPNGPLPGDAAVKYNFAYGINLDGGNNNCYVDFWNLETLSGQYRGASQRDSGSGTLAGGNNPNGMLMALNNLNNAGVEACGNGEPCHLETAANVALLARSATRGFEIAVPLADIGLGSVTFPHRVRVWTYITGGGPGGFGSDQGLPSLRNVSDNGAQVENAGNGPNNYTDPFNATIYRNFEARAAEYTLAAGVPAATVTSAVSRRSNPRAGLVPPNTCDTNLLPPRKSEPHQGGVQQVRIGFNLAPGGGGTGATLDQATCAAPAFVPYSGASVMSGSVVGNELVLTFTPALQNARTYRVNLGPTITSVAGQTVIVRGLVGDVDNSGFVNAGDRSAVVSAWTGSGFSCPTDLDNSGSTNAGDRSVAVSAWTGGPSTNCAP